VIVYIAIVFLPHGEQRIAGVAATEADAASLAMADRRMNMTLSSRYCRGELEDENGDLVGRVFETAIGQRIEYHG
jgi:hypothetical protein